ncbi:MAG TPA: hypothetical protein VIT89_02285 [Solirubrobacterales bacterium]
MVPCAVVEEAELKLANGKATFEEVEPRTSNATASRRAWVYSTALGT